jgi:Flp pilus assembly protein TadB
MPCVRCAAADVMPSGWCSDCERQHDTWSRQHATDILWQAGSGAAVAMVVGLGAPLLGMSPLLGILGVIFGASTFGGLRVWGNRRRRQQFITTSLPRAYLAPPR